MTDACPECSRSFTRSDNLTRHLRSMHGPRPSSSSTPPQRKDVSHVDTPPHTPSEEDKRHAQELTVVKAKLDERERAITAKERSAKERESAAARALEGVRGREAALARRERAVCQAEEATSAEKIRREIAQFKEGLPEHEEGELARFDGTDYRVENGGLTHVYFPAGEKHEHEEGDLFRVGETVYLARDGGAVRLSDGEIVEIILEGEAEDAAEADAPVEEE
jgi:hypothetical protein